MVFDKTGTLTEPLLGAGPRRRSTAALLLAASLAAHSRHPLARALVAAGGRRSPPARGRARNMPGQGLCCAATGEIRLGSRGRFAASAGRGDRRRPCPGTLAGPPRPRAGPLRLRRSGCAPTRRPPWRGCAALGLEVHLLSGDRAASVARVAAALGIADWQAGTDAGAEGGR